jgi:hypothetical protein
VVRSPAENKALRVIFVLREAVPIEEICGGKNLTVGKSLHRQAIGRTAFERYYTLDYGRIS